MYGPTETTVWSTVQRITASEGPVAIGRPIANTQTYVLDAHRGLVPSGVVGELYIGGDGPGPRLPESARPDTRSGSCPTRSAPGARLYRTGDLARWRPDGSLECLGRTDHQVKVRGFRIELGEIEAALRTVTGVREVVVVAERQGTGEPRLVAYWVGEAERQDLYQCARNVLAPYMVPSAYARLGAFPLTPSGKIDRKALPSPDAIQADSTQLLRPRNDREVLVASVWAEVLGVDSVGIDQDFFALGGTSLLAIRARGRLEQEAGVEIPLRAFFEGPTVATIAAGLGTKADPAEPIVVHMGRGAAGQPLLFLPAGNPALPGPGRRVARHPAGRRHARAGSLPARRGGVALHPGHRHSLRRPDPRGPAEGPVSAWRLLLRRPRRVRGGAAARGFRARRSPRWQSSTASYRRSTSPGRWRASIDLVVRYSAPPRGAGGSTAHHLRRRRHPPATASSISTSPRPSCCRSATASRKA